LCSKKTDPISIYYSSKMAFWILFMKGGGIYLNTIYKTDINIINDSS
jgi:hypothetical protein